MNKPILILSFLALSLIAFAQDKQVNCSDSIRLYADSVSRLNDSIHSLNDTIKLYQRDFKSVEKLAEDYKKKYEQLKQTDKQAKLKEIEKEKDQLAQQLKDTTRAKAELEQTLRQQLKQKQEELDKLQDFKRIWIAQLLNEKKSVLNKHFSEISQQELNTMLEQTEKVKDEKDIPQLISQIKVTQTNLNIYNAAKRAVNQPYSSDSVQHALQAIGKIALNKFPQAQQEDIQLLTRQLNTYQDAVKKFKAIISYFNKQLKVQREMKDAKKCHERLAELYNDIADYEKSINLIPYLNRLLSQYRTDLKHNPLEQSAAEIEINNTQL